MLSVVKIKHILLKPRISPVVFLLFIFFAAGVTWYAETNGKLERGMNPSAPYALGDVIRAGNISFIVEKLRRDSQGAGPLTPRAGYEFLVPTVVLKNEAEKPFDFIPLLSFYVKDQSGNVYPIVAVPSEGSQLSGPLLPHDTLREEVGFEVPSGASGLVLYFEAVGVDRNIVAVNLEHHTLWQTITGFLLNK